MKYQDIDVADALEQAKRTLKEDQSLSESARTVLSVLIALVSAMAVMIKPGKSSTSSTPPSQDPNRCRNKNSKKGRGKRKPGGQPGRNGVNLKPVEVPDRIEELKIDRRTLPKGNWRVVGEERRQVFDVKFSVEVTEFRAEILENDDGERFVAEFPFGVNASVQYGSGVKAQTVYNSTYQYQSFERVAQSSSDLFGIDLSEGSVGNFRKQAYELLESFEDASIAHLQRSNLLHNDETGTRIGKHLHWIQSCSNNVVTVFYPHRKRGKEAMDSLGILPHFSGIAVHDCYSSYFSYACEHALCGAHLIRELQGVIEVEQLKWATKMKDLLIQSKDECRESKNNKLTKKRFLEVSSLYESILAKAEDETPLNRVKPKKGKAKQTTSRNLLERFKKYKKEILRFTSDSLVPFTNNLAEADIRMVKLHGKVSGCFRSYEGALQFCRIRGFISTCKKNGIQPFEGFKALFNGEVDKIIEQIFSSPPTGRG